jgi:hypothetical protein
VCQKIEQELSVHMIPAFLDETEVQPQERVNFIFRCAVNANALKLNTEVGCKAPKVGRPDSDPEWPQEGFKFLVVQFKVFTPSGPDCKEVLRGRWTK